jgi:hypothetical protein
MIKFAGQKNLTIKNTIVKPMKKIIICVLFASFVFNFKDAKCQIVNKIVHYKFDEPYFMGEGFSEFLWTKINLKERDYKTGVDGKVVVTFTLTKDNKIKNLVVTDSTTNEHYNKQFYDAIADHPKSWQVGYLNGQAVDVNMRVNAKFCKVGNPGSLFTGSIGARQVTQGWEMYQTIGDYEYMIDNLLSNNYYETGVKASEENNYAEAIKFFDEVIGFSAGEVDALYSRGICKYKSDDKAGACEDWKKIQSLGKPDADKLLLKYCNN